MVSSTFRVAAMPAIRVQTKPHQDVRPAFASVPSSIFHAQRLVRALALGRECSQRLGLDREATGKNI